MMVAKLIPAARFQRRNRAMVEKLARWEEESHTAPDQFWAEIARRLMWQKAFTKVSDCSFSPPVQIKWFDDGVLNACQNCLDRHLPHHADRIALIWEGDTPGQVKKWSYQRLYEETCRIANVLKARGISKGDVVTIYMPLIPEAIASMLACARIGAIHSVVFAGFAAKSLQERIRDAGSQCVITANQFQRGGKTTHLKKNVDAALESCDFVHSVLVVERLSATTEMKPGRDLWYHESVAQAPDQCPCEPLRAEDTLFILYTSGSTGKPKGLVHSVGGYLVYASFTHELVFDYVSQDIYWCTADIGWITGHSYVVYGPLSNASTIFIHEGTPNYPDEKRIWQLIERHRITTLYTAPTAIRALMQTGIKPSEIADLSSLRLLGTVGEPINPEAWLWFYQQIGHENSPVVDTWWQTETGGIMIAPLWGRNDLKPGAATKALPGITPVLLDGENRILTAMAAEGRLCMAHSWPGQARTIFGDHNRFEEVYFQEAPGYYLTGDGAKRDESGDYWITGRLDDTLNVSGHRIGTAEIESALVAHPAVAEAAVIGMPHDIKGQAVFAYVILMAGQQSSAELITDLRNYVRQDIGGLAVPEQILPVPGLPKTRSGKIMRRILRKIIAGETRDFGDLSTLAEPQLVDTLVALYQKNRS